MGSLNFLVYLSSAKKIKPRKSYNLQGLDLI